ncbi:MAG: glycine--tRNA ligase [Candidatus Nealsonbacteria bacterium]|nr:glycine--tRNA ligase [Candidatus Nealsonbacteria bacterium]
MTSIDKIISLCKRRGFIFPSSDIYGGLANSWDFGPMGVELKNNIKSEWWKIFVHSRNDMVGLDSAIIMNPKVWESSGHTKGFSDPLVECKKCHRRFRVDHIVGDDVWNKVKDFFEEASNEDKEKKIKEMIPECPECKEKESIMAPRNFNLMLKTFLGVVEDKTSITYLRPETAQGMFVNFKNILDSSRKQVPFGMAQIGKAFRNEITPGNYIFRTREFEQMEIEYFIPVPKDDKEWQDHFEHWRKQMAQWITHLGIDYSHIHELDVPKEDLAHYSKKTIDFEYEFPFGLSELYGLAYRTDFDLKNHENGSGENMKFRDPESGEEYWPHVIEPTFGIERTLLAVLVEAFNEEEVSSDDTRIVMKFPGWIAPVKVAVLPLVKNKEEIVSKATKIFNRLQQNFVCQYDASASIGKRYRRQDEIGTPFCVTIDFESLENNEVTVRDRDTMNQVRVNIDELENYLKENLNKK